jgi:cytochrome c556
MNDDFLYRIRTEPPAHFTATLKARLDAAPRRRAQALRFGLGALLFGTAFAMVVPGVRQSIVALLDGRETDTSSASFAPNEETPASGIEAHPPAPNDEASSTNDTSPNTPALKARSARHGSPSPPVSSVAPASSEPIATVQTPSADISPVIEEASREDAVASLPILWPVAVAPDALETTAATRRALFKLIGWSFDPVARMLKRQIPFDAGVADRSAFRLEQLASMIDEVAALDTRGSTTPSAARDEIWTGGSEFRARSHDLIEATRALREASMQGNRADVLREGARVGRACSACHDRFKFSEAERPLPR